MNAMSDLSCRIRNVLRVQPFVDRLPRLAAIVGSECTSRGDCDVDAIRIFGIEDDRVQAHPSSAGLPLRSGAVTAQAGEFLPVLPAIGRLEQRRIFDPGVNGVGIGERWLEMPDALKLPRMLRAVVELVRREWRGGGVVDELVAFALRHPSGAGCFPGRRARLMPCLAAIVRALDDLAKPSAGLRRVDTIWIGRRSLEVIELPSGEMRAR